MKQMFRRRNSLCQWDLDQQICRNTSEIKWESEGGDRTADLDLDLKGPKDLEKMAVTHFNWEESSWAEPSGDTEERQTLKEEPPKRGSSIRKDLYRDSEGLGYWNEWRALLGVLVASERKELIQVSQRVYRLPGSNLDGAIDILSGEMVKLTCTNKQW